jgi:hypothetical protein
MVENCVLSCTKIKEYQAKAISWVECLHLLQMESTLHEKAGYVLWMDLLQLINTKHLVSRNSTVRGM